jgi:hypothetical protein
MIIKQVFDLWESENRILRDTLSGITSCKRTMLVNKALELNNAERIQTEMNSAGVAQTTQK